jgi:L-iditol 2-dehydrogenase
VTAARTNAVVLGERGRTRLEARPVPSPGPGELLLRLRACGLCGTDLFKIENGAAPPGTVLGHEVVGTVEASGEGLEGFQPGDRVVVPHHVACGRCTLCLRGSETLCAAFRENLLEPGGFSELILVRERAARQAVRRVPDTVPDEAAVFMEPAACVIRAASRSGLPGAPDPEPPCAVVIGAGSMGLLHVLVLRALHPRLTIIACDVVDERLRIAERLGADAGRTPGEGLEAEVREATSGLGADAVFDTVGGARVLEAALGLTREGGTVVLFAHAPAGERATFELNPLFKAERRISGAYSGSLAEQETAHALIAAGRLDPSPLVTHTLPLSRFEEALELARSRQALKVLLVPDGGTSRRP